MYVRHNPMRFVSPSIEFIIGLILAVVVVLLLSSCASTAPTVPATVVPEPTAAPTPAAPTVTETAPIDTALSAEEPLPYGWRQLATASEKKSAALVVMSPLPALATPEPPTLQKVALVAPTAEPIVVPATASPATAEPAKDPAAAALVAYAALSTGSNLSTTLSIPSVPTAAAEPAPTATTTTTPAPAVAEEAALDRPEWIINVATYSAADDAKRHVERLTANGFKATSRQETVRGRVSYRVVIESLPSEAAAQSALADLSTRTGNDAAWVMRKR